MVLHRKSQVHLSCTVLTQTPQGFEWLVRDVHRLRDLVEGVDAVEVENPDFEILKQSPMLGDNKFKLEIGTSSKVHYALVFALTRAVRA